MCGRAYETYTDEELYFRYLKGKYRPFDDFKPNYNMAPTHLSPVVVFKEGGRRIEKYRWGLVPSWAKTVKDAEKYSLINAKSEEITEKRTYKIPFQKRRCIIPLSGFFEWKREGEKGKKRPFAIHLKDNSIMSVAGVWEDWLSNESRERVLSFSIITTSANSFMEKIHNRMPVILRCEDEEAWLNSENSDTDSLKRMLNPCPSDWLEANEVSTLVNSPLNNKPEVLLPLEA